MSQSISEGGENTSTSNYWLYALQLNIYGYILSSEYGMKVGSLYLAVVHPDIGMPKLILCPRLDAEIEMLVDYEILCGRARARAVPGQRAPFVL